MEHQDKNKVYSPITPVPPGTILLTPDQAFAAEMNRDKKAKIKAVESYGEQVQVLSQKFEDFKKDTTISEQVDKHGIEWFGAGFIVHLFVADFSAESKLILDAGLQQKFTPYAKIISASPYNTTDTAKRVKEGDIIHLGDFLATAATNPAWIQFNGQGASTNQKQVGKPPLQYIRAVYTLITGGKLYYPDKAKFLLSNEFVLLADTDLSKFPGPFVFELDEYSIGTKKINKNPYE